MKLLMQVGNPWCEQDDDDQGDQQQPHAQRPCVTEADATYPPLSHAVPTRNDRFTTNGGIEMLGAHGTAIDESSSNSGK